MLTFAMPWVFLLLPLPFLVRYVIPTQKNNEVALTIPFYETLKALLPKFQKQQTEKKTFYWFFIIWCLLLIGAAKPIQTKPPIALEREGRNIMLIMDISVSMALKDMMYHGKPTTRLAMVQKVANDFILSRKDARFGLILFGSRAYLQTPLTFDHSHLIMRINDATPGLAGQSTAIGDAIGLAVKRLNTLKLKTPIMILLTDGVNNSGVLSPEKAALLAKHHHIKLYTIGLGSEALFALPSNSPQETLDETTLEKIAELTGGTYFKAQDEASLKKAYQLISDLEQTSAGKQTIHPEKALYPWPLGLAILLFFMRTYEHHILRGWLTFKKYLKGYLSVLRIRMEHPKW